MDDTTQGLAIAAGGALAASALLSLLKGALSNLNAAQAIEESAPADRDRLKRALLDVESLLGGVRLADLACDAAGLACLVLFWHRLFPTHGTSILAGVAATTAVAQLLLGEALPAAVGRRRPESIAQRLAPLAATLLAPAVLTARWIGWAASRIAPITLEAPGSDGKPLDEEIRSAVSAGEREMIEGIIDLRDALVNEVMTPRTDMATLDVETPLDAAVQFAVDDGHSRLPVHGENRDDIIGILYVKDLLRLWREGDREGASLRDIIRQPFFIPETTLVADALREFRARKVHIAIAVDEYGGTAGLLTIEDVIEEIVGEIEDEYDDTSTEQPIQKLDDQTAEMPARTRLDEVEGVLGIELPDNGTYETVGGFLIASIGRIPGKGDRFAVNGFDFTVLDADERRIKRLRLHVREHHSDRN
ncbi:MAG: hemolysin family protein [Planctomycetota bacterium]